MDAARSSSLVYPVVLQYSSAYLAHELAIGNTYVSESCSEWAPHQPVYDGIDARVETTEDGQPTQ